MYLELQRQTAGQAAARKGLQQGWGCQAAAAAAPGRMGPAKSAGVEEEGGPQIPPWLSAKK